MATRRVSRVRIETVLNRTTEPIFLIGPERDVLFFNGACEQLTGYTADQALGLYCPYRGPLGTGDLPDLGASLAPPPDAFAGEPVAIDSLFVRPTGERLWRRIHFFPCRDESGPLAGVLGIVSEQGKPAAAQPAAPHVELHTELLKLRDRLYRQYGFDRIVSASPVMARVLEQLRVASQSDVNVVVWGEPGSGRELVARTIHAESARRAAPFVPVDCGLIPPELLEQDLFGAGPGRVATSARGRLGLVEVARSGTLFLKSLSRLPRDLQSRLVEMLRDPSSSSTGRVPERRGVRVIAADASDPAAAVERGELRLDLYFALSTLVIHLPPLRERHTDFPLLVQMCVESANAGEKQVAGVSPAALEVLRAYAWPGNVRELDEVVRMAHAQCRSNLIEPEDLTPRIQGALGAIHAPPPATDLKIDLDAVLLKAERKLIELALQKARGNKSRAAELLSISRPRLYRRMELLGMEEGAPPESTMAEQQDE